MRLTTTLTAALRIALVANMAACIDTDDLFADEENAELLTEDNYGQTEQAVGSCTYRLAAAAITKQIVSIDEPTQILYELVTMTDKPYRMQLTSTTFPAGFDFVSQQTTSCIDYGTQWKCRHQATIENTTATSGTGAYSMSFTPVADAGSGCYNAPSQRIDFWLTTESFQPYSLDASGHVVLMFPAWNYEGTPASLYEGPYQFIGSNLSFNDVASSIKVAPGFAVTIYETAWFSGRSKTLTADNPWLSDFNDIASSAYVWKL